MEIFLSILGLVGFFAIGWIAKKINHATRRTKVIWFLVACCFVIPPVVVYLFIPLFNLGD